MLHQASSIHPHFAVHGFVVLLLLFSAPVFASPASEIEAIKQRYEEIQQRTKEKEAFYQHEISINSNSKEAPAVGNYGKRVTYYMTSPRGPFEGVFDAIPVKLRVRTFEASEEYTGEYIFNDRGRLIFLYEKAANVERRFYFSGGKLIRVILDKKIDDAPNQTQAKKIQKRADDLVGLLDTLHRVLP